MTGTRDALGHKIIRGDRCGKVRFGFDLAADGTNLVPNPAEQEAIGWMVALRDAGCSLREIADELTRHGVATKEGGREWTHTAS